MFPWQQGPQFSSCLHALTSIFPCCLDATESCSLVIQFSRDLAGLGPRERLDLSHGFHVAHTINVSWTYCPLRPNCQVTEVPSTAIPRVPLRTLELGNGFSICLMTCDRLVPRNHRTNSFWFKSPSRCHGVLPPIFYRSLDDPLPLVPMLLRQHVKSANLENGRIVEWPWRKLGALVSRLIDSLRRRGQRTMESCCWHHQPFKTGDSTWLLADCGPCFLVSCES